MISPIILKSLNSNLQITQENEILALNEKSNIYGLTLNKEDLKEIINSRDNTLKSYGRIELDIGITKMIIENLYKSQYTDKDDYVYAINDLHEVFYYLKNETLDQQTKEVKNTNITDDDMMAAVLVATIDYRNEVKKDVRLVSVKEVK